MTLLDTSPPPGLPDGTTGDRATALVGRAKELSGVIAAAEAERARLVADLIDVYGYKNQGHGTPGHRDGYGTPGHRDGYGTPGHRDGFRSLGHELSFELGVTSSQARDLIAVAQGRGRLPLLARAADQGRINTRVAATITEVATEENEADLVDLLDVATTGQIQRICRTYRTARRATAPDSGETLGEDEGDSEAPESGDEFLSLTLGDDAGWRLNGYLRGADGERLRQALAEKRDELYRTTGTPASNVDALRALLLDGPGTSGADRYLALINVDLADYRAGEAGAGSVVGGPGLADDELARILDDCSAIVVVSDDGHPVWVSDKARTPPPWMRRLLRSRDVECSIAGCGSRGYLEAHHITPYRDRPVTDYTGVRLICGFHHCLLHRLDLTVTERADGSLSCRLPDGTPLADPSQAGPTPKPPNLSPFDVLTKRAHHQPIRGPDRAFGDPLTHYGLDCYVGHLLDRALTGETARAPDG